MTSGHCGFPLILRFSKDWRRDGGLAVDIASGFVVAQEPKKGWVRLRRPSFVQWANLTRATSSGFTR